MQTLTSKICIESHLDNIKDAMQYQGETIIANGSNTPEAFVGLASKMNVVISSRLHLLIFASISATPCIGIERGSKVRNFLSEFGQYTTGTTDHIEFHQLDKTLTHLLSDPSEYKAKAKSVNEKYIVPPKTTDFGIVYAPTESLYKELTDYQDPNTKDLLTQELMKKYKIVIMGPNTLSAYLQSLHMGFQSLKVQKGATEIYNHLKTISTRFAKHFDNVIVLRKKLEEAMKVVDTFGTDARSITRTLENIKDPEQVEIAAKTENVEKFVDHSKQLKN